MTLTTLPKLPNQGDIIGGEFALGRELGRGSMGAVFEAHQVGLKRKVALKMLLPRTLALEGVVERFQRGARHASSLKHPNAVVIYGVGVHELGDDECLPFMVMEHLEGEDLYEMIAREGRLDLRVTMSIVLQALGVIGEAHAKGIVHRDLKPENLFMCRGGEQAGMIKVLDFGLAKAITENWGELSQRLTAAGMTCGTPEYMAPEQAVGEDKVGPELDVYAMGCIIYHMLSGRPPFIGKGPLAVALKHVQDTPPRLPAEYRGSFVEAIVDRCLAKQPWVRFHSAAELEEAILAGMAGEKLVQRPDWPSPQELSNDYRQPQVERTESVVSAMSPEWGTQETLQMTPTVTVEQDGDDEVWVMTSPAWGTASQETQARAQAQVQVRQRTLADSIAEHGLVGDENGPRPLDETPTIIDENFNILEKNNASAPATHKLELSDFSRQSETKIQAKPKPKPKRAKSSKSKEVNSSKNMVVWAMAGIAVLVGMAALAFGAVFVFQRGQQPLKNTGPPVGSSSVVRIECMKTSCNPCTPGSTPNCAVAPSCYLKGCSVYRGQEKVGVTPYTLKADLHSAPVKLYVKQKGYYKSSTVDVKFDREQKTLWLELESDAQP